MNSQGHTLRVDQLSKSFGNTKALKDVSLTIKSGCVHTVFGENGSGKSTLVKLISGIIPPDKGLIEIDGVSVKKHTPKTMINLGVVVVLQEVLIAPNLPVPDNIFIGVDSFFSRPYTIAQKREKARQILSELTQDPFDFNIEVSKLPLREQQLIVIARGFAGSPKVLILDEATAAIDLADRNNLFAMIKKFTENGGSVVFVSHRLPEILEISHEVFVLRNGELISEVKGDDINSDKLIELMV